MNTIDAIMTRVSIRRYKDMPVGENEIKTILKAGMSGPSCVNSRDWSFIVVRNKDRLNAMADVNGKYAQMLRNCAFAVLVCGDMERAFPAGTEYWVIDGSIAAQNMILAAKDLGIGSVWLGTWPSMDRVDGQAKLFNLPETQIPHSIIAFGYPDEDPAIKAPEWEADRVHFEEW